MTNCSLSSPLPSSFIQKYCQYDYSEVILKGEFGTLFKELTEVRYAMDHDLPVYQSANLTLLDIK
jgi:hypothetical protein